MAANPYMLFSAEYDFNQLFDGTSASAQYPTSLKHVQSTVVLYHSIKPSKTQNTACANQWCSESSFSESSPTAVLVQDVGILILFATQL